MPERISAPYLFDTSAESWFARTGDPGAASWWRNYLKSNEVHVSSITVFERLRGYALLWRRSNTDMGLIEAARAAYFSLPRTVLPVDEATAAVAAEISALIPEPPTPPRHSHRLAESKSERLARWRFDAIIAATGLVSGMTLIHNNPGDFEAIRSRIETNPARFPRLGPLNLIRCESVAFR